MLAGPLLMAQGSGAFDLFAVIEIEALSSEEMASIEGEGIISAIGGGVAGFIKGVIFYGVDVAIDNMAGVERGSAKQELWNMSKAAAVGAATGFVVGLIVPLP